jgi:hypothetical protein
VQLVLVRVQELVVPALQAHRLGVREQLHGRAADGRCAPSGLDSARRRRWWGRGILPADGVFMTRLAGGGGKVDDETRRADEEEVRCS